MMFTACKVFKKDQIDLDRFSINFWLTKFVEEVVNKTGGCYPPCSLYKIVCGLKHIYRMKIEGKR